MNGIYLRAIEVDCGNLVSEEQNPGSHAFQCLCSRHAQVGRAPVGRVAV